MTRFPASTWLSLLALMLGTGAATWSQESEPTLKGKIVLFGKAESADARTFWIRTMARDGSVETVAQVEPEALSGRVSPDGSRVAFGSTRDARTGVWLLSADGRDRSLLIQTSGEVWIGGWSPDAKRIIYGEGEKGNRSNFIVDVETKAVQPLRLPPTETVWDWSPDGKGVLTISDRDTGRQIQYARLDAPDLTCLTDTATDNIRPRFSPDGAKILFSSPRTRRAQLYVMDRDGRNVVQITKFDDRSTGCGCWSPDGKEICCRSYKTGPVTEHGYEVFDQHLIVMNADGSDAKVFLPADGSDGWTLDWR